jgi:hypothetical protein
MEIVSNIAGWVITAIRSPSIPHCADFLIFLDPDIPLSKFLHEQRHIWGNVQRISSGVLG